MLCFLVAELKLDMFFFFDATASPESYTLSLHDALPISGANERVAEEVAGRARRWLVAGRRRRDGRDLRREAGLDRKSTRLNSSHRTISYAVFCLKKKKKNF